MKKILLFFLVILVVGSLSSPASAVFNAYEYWDGAKYSDTVQINNQFFTVKELLEMEIFDYAFISCDSSGANLRLYLIRGYEPVLMSDPFYTWWFQVNDSGDGSVCFSLTFTDDGQFWSNGQNPKGISYDKIRWSSVPILSPDGTVIIEADSYFYESPSEDLPELPEDDSLIDSDGSGTAGDSNTDWFGSILRAILGLPGKLADAVKNAIQAIFVPDVDNLEDSLLRHMADFRDKFGADFHAFDSLFRDEKPIEDLYVSYSVPGAGVFRLKIIDSSLIHSAVSFFRPIIRGWLVVLLIIFTWNNFLGLIRQAAPIAPSAPSESSFVSISDTKSTRLQDGTLRTITRGKNRRF